jgi:hypothetical protein
MTDIITPEIQKDAAQIQRDEIDTLGILDISAAVIVERTQSVIVLDGSQDAAKDETPCKA